MLITKAQIEAAMNMSAVAVNEALRSNGYEDTVRSAVFSGMTDIGSFVYRCTYFDNHTAANDECTIYVHYNSFEKLVADF